jgi:predicted nucleic acid-binding protein
VKKVFADAAYFIALLKPADNFHARAVALARRPPGPIITTYWILAEVGDAFSQPGNRSKFARLIALAAATPDIEVLRPTIEQFLAGAAIHASRPDKRWSFTDCITFSVMKEHGLADALTTDSHFEQAGFRALMRVAN